MLPPTWISKLAVDLIGCTIGLEGTCDPERLVPISSMELKFREVGNVRIDRYHDLDNVPCYGDFTGIRVENLDQGRARFSMDTGDAFLIFEAAADPSLIIPEGSQISSADVFSAEGSREA